jgi:hypothetical protein
VIEQLPTEAQYLACLIEDRWRRATSEISGDTGLNTLEVIVLAALIVPAALALGVFLVGKIQQYQGKIK